MGEIQLPCSELRVLVVDDDADATTALSYLLQSLGCKTAVANGGAAAVRVAEIFNPVVVVLDLEMPDLDGCEVLARVRDLDSAAACAYMACLTGRGDDATRAKCMALGFDCFCTKPLDPGVLNEILAAGHRRADELSRGAAAVSPPKPQ